MVGLDRPSLSELRVVYAKYIATSVCAGGPTAQSTVTKEKSLEEVSRMHLLHIVPVAFDRGEGNTTGKPCPRNPVLLFSPMTVTVNGSSFRELKLNVNVTHTHRPK